MLHICIGSAGCGKSTWLINQIDDQVKAGESVLTLVPEQFDYEFDRKLYAQLGAKWFNRLQTHSFKSLAKEIINTYSPAQHQKTYADAYTKYALLYQAILYTTTQGHTLRALEKQCQQTSFVEDLSNLFKTFRQNNITESDLYTACEGLHGRILDKTIDVYSLFHEYNRLLQEYNLKDTETDVTEAASIANIQNLYIGDVLFLDEFDMFTEDEYQMLEVLFAACKDIYITLRMENMESMPYSLFETDERTYHRICNMAKDLHIPIDVYRCNTPYRFKYEDLRWLSQHIFRAENSNQTAPPMEHIHIVEASNPNEEVDYVCTTIRHLLVQQPDLRCQDIVILTNTLSDYQSVLESAMQRYELPYHLDIKKSVDYYPIMIYLQTLLELLRRKNPDTELLLRLGKTGLTSCTPDEIAQLENYCYYWRVDGKTWLSPFTSGEDAIIVETVHQKLWTPIASLKEKCSGTHTGGEYCHILYDFIDKENVQDRLYEAIQAACDEEQEMQAQEDLAFVWNSWIDVLDHMASIYADVDIELTNFCQIFSFLLQNVKRSIPPATLDAILISSGRSVRLPSPKVVFLLGLCEGTFPMAPGGNAIFSENDCQMLEASQISVMQPADIQYADARLSAYAQLCAPSESLYLLYPKANLQQEKCYPSSTLNQIQHLFPDTSSQRELCSEHSSLYYATTLRAMYVQYVQNYAKHTEDVKIMQTILREDPYYCNKLDTLFQSAQNRARKDDTPLYQLHDKRTLKQRIGTELTLSNASYERYKKCPFQYYCQDILRIAPRQRFQIAGVSRGSLIHTCLQQILTDYPKDQFIALTQDELYQIASSYAKQYWTTQMGGDFSKSKRDLASYRHIVSEMVPMLQHLQEELAQSDFYPCYMELKISNDSIEFPPIHLRTQHGDPYCFTGKVDRVDLCDDDDQKTRWVRVIDYKTGSKNFSLGHVYYGLDLQMLIYLFTITSPGSALQNASPAGVLYMPAGNVHYTRKRSDTTTPEEQLNKNYRMNGLLLKNAHLITLMDKNGEGIYVPQKLKDANSDKITVNLITESEMDNLYFYVMDILQETADEIYDGQIDASPFSFDTVQSCQYCVYQNICGNVNQVHERHENGTATQAAKLMLEKLDQPIGDGEEEV